MKKLTNITGIILFIVLFSVSANGQKKMRFTKKLNKKQINITASPIGLSNPTVTYSGNPISAGSYTVVADFTKTEPTNTGSYTVVPNIVHNNVFNTDLKPTDNPGFLKKYILPSLPYVAIGLSLLLAIFFYLRNRDEVITLPDEFNQNY